MARIEQYQPDYYAPETVLVLSRSELDTVAKASAGVLDFTRRVNAAATTAGYDPERRGSHFWSAGIRSVRVWLDGVTQIDPRVRAVALRSGRCPDKSDCEYRRRIPGGCVCVVNHIMACA